MRLRAIQLHLILGASLAASYSSASANETTTYTYDALGRLIGTASTGGPASGVSKTLAYDPAGNRQQVVVTGAANLSRAAVVAAPKPPAK